MLILGVNAYHGDSSACLLGDGLPLGMAEEERFRRVKHWAGCPSQAVAAVLDDAGADLSDVDRIAVNRDPDANLGRKALHVLKARPRPGLVLDRLRNRRSVQSVADCIARDLAFGGTPPRTQLVEHHRAHLASTYLVSPFEEAAVVSVDGFGDFASAAWGVGRGTEITIRRRVYFPHSLGIFYTALTQFLGFERFGDEYKVMGLAPYGEPKFERLLAEVLAVQSDGTFKLDLSYFRHHDSSVDYRWTDCAPSFAALFTSKLERLLGPRFDPNHPVDERRRDLACSVQAAYEAAFFALLRRVHEDTGLMSVALSGGCAMNSVAIGKISEKTPFERVYVQPAAGDAGGALGAALSVWHESRNGTARTVMDHAYWGPRFDTSRTSSTISSTRLARSAPGCSVSELDEETLCSAVSHQIAEGSVVGWFQGRMEWGPRALGNRSILGDPRRADMRDVLNLKIKMRETFRPFAPSVLEESFSDWYEADEPDWFMTRVLRLRGAHRGRVPAVTHVDGTGRPQAVRESTNPRYHRLISRFEADTGIPMVLNTSFNENEPIVCRPEEAIDCFLRTDMDVLALGDLLIEKPQAQR
jgi:carbamoyltransferase